MIVREFQRSDLQNCLDLNQMQFEESKKFTHLYFDFTKIKNAYLNSINNPKLKVFVLESDDKKIVGVCAVTLSQFLWNYNLLVRDLFYYIHPNYRKGLSALKIYKKIEEFAKLNNAVEIQFNYAHGDEFDKMQMFFNRLGYKKFNESYRKLVF